MMRVCAMQKKLMPLVMELSMFLAQDLEKLENSWQKLKELWAGCCPGQQSEPEDYNTVGTAVVPYILLQPSKSKNNGILLSFCLPNSVQNSCEAGQP